jgi:DNA-binding XRE family transcriptional regulator
METSVKVKLNPEENLLKQIRQALEMTQEEFGRTIGVHQTSVARWETGRSKPTFTLAQIKALQREMRKLGLDFDDLPDDLN